MFTAIFQDHYGYLTACTLVSVALGVTAWLVAGRVGNPFGVWWGGLTGTLVGVLGVTFMGSGPAYGQCVINHNLAEPFHSTQGLWNLGMTVPLGLFALLAVRRVLPALVGVIALPLAIEFTQATVNGLGRVCDSADAEMNILGGLVGLAVAAVVLTRRDALDWHAGAKASLITSAVVLTLGAGVGRPMLNFTHIDGSGLSAAGSSQRQAVEHAVQEAFGDHYELGKVYEQPCVGASCTNVIFTLLSRDKDHPEAFSNGSLSWPDKKRLNVLLEDSDRPGVMAYPLAGATAPSTEQEAYRIAQKYTDDHYAWAKSAVEHKTYPVGEKAELGWMTSWRWLDDNVLMPRMLDVQVDKAGRVSQVDVTLGPTHAKLAKAKLDAGQAEESVRRGLVAQNRANGGDWDKRRVEADVEVKAFTLKAVEREGTWQPEWLVNVSMRTESQATDSPEAGQADLWRVNAVSGQVYDGTDTPTKS